MKVKELIEALSRFPDDLEVMAAGEKAKMVAHEVCKDHEYVRIFEGTNVEFILGSAGMGKYSDWISTEKYSKKYNIPWSVAMWLCLNHKIECVNHKGHWLVNPECGPQIDLTEE